MRFWALVPIVPVIYLFLFLIEGRNYSDFLFQQKRITCMALKNGVFFLWPFFLNLPITPENENLCL
jgi:hypothetical protein